MKTKLSLLPVHIALLTLAIVLEIWRANAFMRIMSETSGADPRIVRKIAELDAGLANGTITVQPTARTKLLRGSVRILLSRLKDDASAYAPYVELTQILLNTAVAV